LVPSIPPWPEHFCSTCAVCPQRPAPTIEKKVGSSSFALGLYFRVRDRFKPARHRTEVRCRAPPLEFLVLTAIAALWIRQRYLMVSVPRLTDVPSSVFPPLSTGCAPQYLASLFRPATAQRISFQGVSPLYRRAALRQLHPFVSFTSRAAVTGEPMTPPQSVPTSRC
jgi:hypothetical protein